jgi:hypothetical protein
MGEDHSPSHSCPGYRRRLAWFRVLVGTLDETTVSGIPLPGFPSPDFQAAFGLVNLDPPELIVPVEELLLSLSLGELGLSCSFFENVNLHPVLGMQFETSGPIDVPHALVPVNISLEHDFGVYVEPGVWVDHRL